jgi:hypothetical protein
VVQDCVETGRVFASPANCPPVSMYRIDRAGGVAPRLSAARRMLEEDIAGHPPGRRWGGSLARFAMHPPCHSDLGCREVLCPIRENTGALIGLLGAVPNCGILTNVIKLLAVVATSLAVAACLVGCSTNAAPSTSPVFTAQSTALDVAKAVPDCTKAKVDKPSSALPGVKTQAECYVNGGFTVFFTFTSKGQAYAFQKDFPSNETIYLMYDRSGLWMAGSETKKAALVVAGDLGRQLHTQAPTGDGAPN